MVKTVTRPIVVEENEPFKHDALGREGFGKSLLKLVSISSDELVISLDGKWGEGKTSFVKMWQGLLVENRIPNIYIDAFKHDYSDDAFIAIAGEIIAYIEKHEKKNGTIAETFKKKAIIVGRKISPLLLLAIDIVASTFGVGIINNIEKLKKIKDESAKRESTIVEALIREKLESYKKDLDEIDSFKTLLSKLSGSINSKQSNQQNSTPLVIIIDELDRCRPTYALDIIEKVKHLFSVKNVVFVLVMNRGQLEESVKSVYGQNIDAHTYLQKFINIETTLPKDISRQDGDNDIAKYNKVLFDSYKEVGGLGDKKILKFLKVLAEHFDLSLRGLEKVYTNLAVFYAMLPNNHPEHPPSILSFLAIIKVIKPSVYKKLLHKEISYEELCENTKLLDKRESQNKKMQMVATVLNQLIITDDEFRLMDINRVRGVNRFLRNYNGIQRQDVIPYLAQKLSMYK